MGGGSGIVIPGAGCRVGVGGCLCLDLGLDSGVGSVLGAMFRRHSLSLTPSGGSPGPEFLRLEGLSRGRHGDKAWRPWTYLGTYAGAPWRLHVETRLIACTVFTQLDKDLHTLSLPLLPSCLPIHATCDISYRALAALGTHRSCHSPPTGPGLVPGMKTDATPDKWLEAFPECQEAFPGLGRQARALRHQVGLAVATSTRALLHELKGGRREIICAGGNAKLHRTAYTVSSFDERERRRKDDRG